MLSLAFPRVRFRCPHLELDLRSGEWPPLPSFDVLNTLTLVLLFTPPLTPVPCPSSMRVESRGGSMNDTLGCVSPVQVEILDSYYQPLHRLHGEQVRAVAPGGVAKIKELALRMVYGI